MLLETKKVDCFAHQHSAIVIRNAPVSFLRLHLYSATLKKKKNDQGEAKVYLILKKAEDHAQKSKQAGDHQGGNVFKHFLLLCTDTQVTILFLTY